MTEQILQHPLPTETVVKPQVKEPFKPEPPPIFSRHVADELDSLIPKMGAEPSSRIPVKPIAVEEQYEVAERRAIATTTTETYYDIITPEPKQILLIAETVDHYVDFNRHITSDSPKIFASGTLSITAKGAVRIYVQAVSATGTLRILVMKR